jgi:prevent-host-death family protein
VTITVGAFEAKTRLSELLARVEAGDEITITKHGRPVARLVAMTPTPARRDWADYWRRVDERRVKLPDGLSIKAAIEEGRE